MNLDELQQRKQVDFEKFGLPEVAAVGHYYSREARVVLRPHLHPDVFEVHAIVRGAQPYFVEGRDYLLLGGDWIITRPDEVHGTAGQAITKCLFYWFQFRDVPAGRSFLGLSPAESQTLLGQFRRVRTHHFHSAGVLFPTLANILTTYEERGDPVQRINLRNLLLRLVLDLVKLTHKQAGVHHTPGIQRARAAIENALAELPTLPALAHTAGMSLSYFQVLFKKETGVSPIEYATRRRVARARERLAGTDRTVTEIALDLGFSSSQHLATVFRRYTGLSPHEFRDRQKPATPPPPPERGSGIHFHPITILGTK